MRGDTLLRDIHAMQVRDYQVAVLLHAIAIVFRDHTR
jgi:hypothetical protein